MSLNRSTLSWYFHVLKRIQTWISMTTCDCIDHNAAAAGQCSSTCRKFDKTLCLQLKFCDGLKSYFTLTFLTALALYLEKLRLTLILRCDLAAIKKF